MTCMIFLVNLRRERGADARIAQDGVKSNKLGADRNECVDDLERANGRYAGRKSSSGCLVREHGTRVLAGRHPIPVAR